MPTELVYFCDVEHFLVMIDIPAEVSGKGIDDTVGDEGLVDGDVMLVSALADELEQVLEAIDPYDASAAEGFERIIGEFAFAGVSADGTVEIVGADSQEGHRTRRDISDDGSVGVIFSDGPGDDVLESHFGGSEEALGEIAAMEHDGAIGIVAVVVIPVEQGRGSTGGGLEDVHSDGAGDIDFAGSGDERVGEQAHDGARDDTVVFFHGGPALQGECGDFVGDDPVFEDNGQPGHFFHGSFRRVAAGDVFIERFEFGFDSGVVGLHFFGAADDFGEVPGLDGDSGVLEDFFAEAAGIEVAGSSADGADSDIFECSQDAAGDFEVGQVLGEDVGFEFIGVPRGQGEGNSVLVEIVADGNLSAEGIAAIFEGHFFRIVAEGMDEDRDVEFGELDAVGDASFVTEVGECDDDTGDFIAIFGKEFCAFFGIVVGLDGSEFGLFGFKADDVEALSFQQIDHGGSAVASKFVREEAAVADDET